ncbi:HK97 family phage prohead protease [Clostridium tertium]|uniref:HK97 family phage prohead protease n=1 Tax=Clostridium tertium TaxID=1559 RepID=UPI000C088C80|nr:HK97 family phage prohead protease [Clostridium tertium]
MEQHYINNKIELRELENGYQLEILVNDYRDSKLLNGKNGKFIENIPKETWENAINESSNIELLIDHSPYVNVAEKIEFKIREDGVYALVTLTNKAKSLYKSIKEHGANGISFGFKCISDKWNGIKRTINKMDLFEISILMSKQPAYNGGYAEVRNIEIPCNSFYIKRKRLELIKLI